MKSITFHTNQNGTIRAYSSLFADLPQSAGTLFPAHLLRLVRVEVLVVGAGLRER